MHVIYFHMSMYRYMFLSSILMVGADADAGTPDVLVVVWGGGHIKFFFFIRFCPNAGNYDFRYV